MGLPISICIPTYNRAALLRRTLERLSAIQHLFSEIVISDNASTDDTGGVIEAMRGRFECVRTIRQSANHGAFRNIAAVQMAATAEYLFVLSDDDEIVPDGFEAAYRELAADPECVAIYGGWMQADAALAHDLGQVAPTAGRFTKADKARFLYEAPKLTFPIVRRTVMQRHCFLDRNSFGFVSLISQLLECGAVRRVPHILYRHANTETRVEAEATEPWYQEFFRSDWEVLLAGFPGASFDLVSQVVAMQTIHVYWWGHEQARRKNLPLLERSYLLRYLAYTAGQNAGDAAQHIAQWERTRLIAAALAQLEERLTLGRPAVRLVGELGTMNLREMLPALAARRPQLEIVMVDPKTLLGWDRQDGDVILAEYWDILAARGARQAADPAREIAVGDVIGTLRLPGSSRNPLLEGPTGTVHFSRQ